MLSSHSRSRPLLVCTAIFFFGTVLLFSSPTKAADDQDAVLVKFEVQLAPSKSGSFILAVHPAWAPLGAERFLNLVDGNGPQGDSNPDISGESFWNGLRFFRVIDGFMAQFGIAPNPEVSASWVNANLKDDPVIESNKKGYVSFATSGEDFRSSQMLLILVTIQGLMTRALLLSPTSCKEWMSWIKYTVDMVRHQNRGRSKTRAIVISSHNFPT